MDSAITVKQLNFYVKSLLEGDSRLSSLKVTGEISNFTNHYASGHWYFTLKDNDAAIRCVMFKSFAARVGFAVKNGMQVVLKGRISLYEKDGQYQFYAEQMSAYGIGDIAADFNKIKEKLLAEGLFDSENKRPLPLYPKKIAVITSPTGAAVQDIINILGRRNPLCEVVMCPVSVQGELAVPEMIETLDRVYSLSEIDLIIIGRGGGSVEDLWAFNSEELARKIYESPIPVISAVGHETDFTICDFVADCRAPTPSAAAELAVPDFSSLKNTLINYNTKMISSLKNKYNLDSSRFSALASSSVLNNPENMIFTKMEQLDKLSDRIVSLQKQILTNKMAMFEKKLAALDALSPLKLLSSGYSVVEMNGKPIVSSNSLKTDDYIDIIFSDGKVQGRII
ncbi:MAG: exodeoxyribonuclease VII large subunit [Ruminococcaceae bacterium]|nr:exodeoxyribonuclease VII large subunit [Oscillospiraceae bacterium]